MVLIIYDIHFLNIFLKKHTAQNIYKFIQPHVQTLQSQLLSDDLLSFFNDSDKTKTIMIKINVVRAESGVALRYSHPIALFQI